MIVSHGSVGDATDLGALTYALISTQDAAAVYHIEVFLALAVAAVRGDNAELCRHTDQRSICTGTRDRKRPSGAAMSTIREIDRICVVGAGAMGAQIAQQCALHGYHVALMDAREEALTRAVASNRGHLQRRVEKQRISADDMEAALGRVTTTTDLEEAAGAADFVIEAIFEEPAAKRDMFARLTACAPRQTIFASNTSAIPISRLAEITDRPDLCVNMHFFNPALVMELVEVGRGPQTSDETVAITLELVRRIGRTPILINKEVAGFVVNRIIGAIFHEAAWLVENGYATIEDVDRAMELGARHPMGPFKLMDFTGIDVSYNAKLNIYRETGDERYKPAEIIEEHVRRGELGIKTGKGFYSYPGKDANR